MKTLLMHPVTILVLCGFTYLSNHLGIRPWPGANFYESFFWLLVAWIVMDAIMSLVMSISRRRKNRHWFVLPLLLLLVGCHSSGNKQIMPADFSDKLKDGVTTKEEVRTILGEPQHLGEITWTSQTITVWRYTGTSRSLNLAAFIPLVDIVAGRQTVLTKWVDCYFDSKDILIKTDIQSDIKENRAPVGSLSVFFAGVGLAAAAPYGYGYGYRGYGYPSKAVIATTPLSGGGSVSTIKWYR